MDAKHKKKRNAGEEYILLKTKDPTSFITFQENTN